MWYPDEISDVRRAIQNQDINANITVVANNEQMNKIHTYVDVSKVLSERRISLKMNFLTKFW